MCSVFHYMEARAVAAVGVVIVTALRDLRRRLGSPLHGTEDARAMQWSLPLFRVTVKLQIPHAVLSPSIPVIQRAANQLAVAVLSVSKRVMAWKLHADLRPPTPAPRGVAIVPGDHSYFPSVCANKDVLKTLLQITGALLGLERGCLTVIQRLAKYDFLWQVRGASLFADAARVSVFRLLSGSLLENSNGMITCGLTAGQQARGCRRVPQRQPDAAELL